MEVGVKIRVMAKNMKREAERWMRAREKPHLSFQLDYQNVNYWMNGWGWIVLKTTNISDLKEDYNFYKVNLLGFGGNKNLSSLVAAFMSQEGVAGVSKWFKEEGGEFVAHNNVRLYIENLIKAVAAAVALREMISSLKIKGRVLLPYKPMGKGFKSTQGALERLLIEGGLSGRIPLSPNIAIHCGPPTDGKEGKNILAVLHFLLRAEDNLASVGEITQTLKEGDYRVFPTMLIRHTQESSLGRKRQLIARLLVMGKEKSAVELFVIYNMDKERIIESEERKIMKKGRRKEVKVEDKKGGEGSFFLSPLEIERVMLSIPTRLSLHPSLVIVGRKIT